MLVCTVQVPATGSNCPLQELINRAPAPVTSGAQGNISDYQELLLACVVQHTYLAILHTVHVIRVVSDAKKGSHIVYCMSRFTVCN